MGCLSPSTGIFFLYGSHTYTCLPTNWTGVCTLVFLIPPVSYTIDSKIISVPVVSFKHTKRDIGLKPLAVGLGFLTWIGTGSAGLGVSISQFQKLSTALKESLNNTALQISAIQDQIDSLAVVVLQNRRGLDLLTAEKGRLCLLLGEDCCFFTNK
jgi:hypothetical protein